MHVCQCMCVYIYIYIYIYMCVCVCYVHIYIYIWVYTYSKEAGLLFWIRFEYGFVGVDLRDSSEMMRDAFANDSGLPIGHSRLSHRIKSTLQHASVQSETQQPKP